MRQFLRASTKVRQRGTELGDIMRGLPHILAPRAPRKAYEPVRLRFVYRDIGAPARYRVMHQVEQAWLAGLRAEALPIDATPSLYDLTACDLLYLYRLPLAPPTLALCIAARRHGIPIIFDSDDLVWDQRERFYNYLYDHYSPERVARLLWATRRTHAMMRYVDAFVFATPYLAQLAAQSFSQPAYVNPNALSSAMLSDAAEAYAERLQRPEREDVVVGYFSGSPRVHDEDVASIVLALCAVLERYPNVRLRIYGELRLHESLAHPDIKARVESRPTVDWRELPRHISAVDINIAPLVDNPQRRAKSAVKYLEAALVGTPTVASQLDPYQHDIVDSVTGLLAATHADWVDCLSRLIEVGDLRRRLGTAARADVLAQHTTAVRATNFAAIITEVAA
jgi:glycosyltransferase involved in cell wall biosynthesis